MNNRIVGIDVVKGISIMLVVIYHAISSNYIRPIQLYDFLTGFLLHAFFFAAGWVYANSRKKHNYKIEIKKKIIGLGIPYILLSAIAIIYQFFVGTVLGNNFISDTYHGMSLLLRNLYCAFSLVGIGTLWFLPVILIANIVLIYLVKKTEQSKKQILIMGVVCLIMHLLVVILGRVRNSMYITDTVSKIMYEELNFLYRIVIGCTFIILGYIANKILVKLNFKNIVNLFIGVVCLVIGAVFYHFQLEIYMVFYTLAETLIVIHICNYRWAAILTRPISYLGENSLYIMVVHYVFVQPVLMNSIWNSHYFIDASLFTKRIVLFVAILPVTLILIEISKKIDGVLFLFGKGERFKELQKRILERGKVNE